MPHAKLILKQKHQKTKSRKLLNSEVVPNNNFSIITEYELIYKYTCTVFW